MVFRVHLSFDWVLRLFRLLLRWSDVFVRRFTAALLESPLSIHAIEMPHTLDGPSSNPQQYKALESCLNRTTGN